MCVCAFFCIPKKGEGLFRPIVNMRPINKCIKYEHFKMESLKSVRFLVRKGDFMVKLDLKDAYFVVQVKIPSKKQGRSCNFSQTRGTTCNLPRRSFVSEKYKGRRLGRFENGHRIRKPELPKSSDGVLRHHCRFP